MLVFAKTFRTWCETRFHWLDRHLSAYQRKALAQHHGGMVKALCLQIERVRPDTPVLQGMQWMCFEEIKRGMLRHKTKQEVCPKARKLSVASSIPVLGLCRPSTLPCLFRNHKFWKGRMKMSLLVTDNPSTLLQYITNALRF